MFYAFEEELRNASLEERDKWVNNFPAGRIPVSASDRDIRWIKKTDPGYFSLYKVQA